MSALTCEVCGGKLVGKPGGIFECEYCGLEYSTEWAKAKIQEIRGTVSVEGTVEVQGTVKVEGSVSKENLIKRGKMALESGDFDQAEKFYEQVLDIDAECAEAYLGKAMARMHVYDVDELGSADYDPEKNVDFQRAAKFGSPELHAHLDAILAVNKSSKAAHEAERRQKRAKYAAARNRIAIGRDFVIGLNENGTVCMCGENFFIPKNELTWRDIVAVAAGQDHVVGLKPDGRVVACGHYLNDQGNVSDWRNVVAISAAGYYTAGLLANGNVVTRGATEYLSNKVSTWRDMVSISAYENRLTGVDKNGKVWSATALSWVPSATMNGQDNEFAAAGNTHIAVLKKDGRVVVSGKNAQKQSEVESWRDIVDIAAGWDCTIGIKSDGTIAEVSEVKECDPRIWTDLVSVYINDGFFKIGVKANGRVVYAGCDFGTGSCDEILNWKLFDNIDTLAANMQAKKDKLRIEIERKREALSREHQELHNELNNLKGIFAGKRRKEIEARLAEIENALKK